MPLPQPETAVFAHSYWSPKKVLLKLVKAGMAKSQLPVWETFLLGCMAGAYIGIGTLLSLLAGGGLMVRSEDGNGIGVANPAITKLVMGAVFPLGLILVVVAGSELFTGNVMYLTMAYLEKRVGLWDVAKNWIVSYTGNLVGSLFVAYFLTYLCGLTENDPHHSFAINVGVYKMDLDFLKLFLRGIGCNWLVCMALFCALATDHLLGKIVAMWWPIFGFVAIGYEHSIADMTYVSISLMEGADRTVLDFVMCLVPVTAGNIVGGFVFPVMAEWLAYGSYIGDVHEHPAMNPQPGPKQRSLSFASRSPRSSLDNNIMELTNRHQGGGVTAAVVVTDV